MGNENQIKMRKLYIIAYRNSAFNYLFEEAEKTENIVVIENGLAAPKNFFKKLTRFLFAGKCPLPISILQTWFNKDFLRQLKNIKDDDALLVFENINLRALGMLYHLLPKNIKKYNWFGNPVYPLFNGKSPMKRFKAIKKLGFELVSFDSQDANQYDMTFHNQFLRFPTQTSGTAPDVDFYFVGGPKDRENYLMELRKFLELRGNICRFLIPHSPQEFISYDENIRNVERCRCIVDIYQSGQTGITRRPLEALFHNKKLLTNNPLIQEMDIYHPNNVYILQEDNWDGISDFLQKPYFYQPDTLKRKYDVKEWLSFFMP